MIGDLNQRVVDNERIERLLTSESIATFFSLISFIVFFFVLFYFNTYILFTYLFFTLLGLTWSIFWIRKKRVLDFYEFLTIPETYPTTKQITTTSAIRETLFISFLIYNQIYSKIFYSIAKINPKPIQQKKYLC